MEPNLTSPEIDQQVRRLLSLALKRPLHAGENPSRASEPGWDSLKHVEIVFLMEDHFRVRFREQELRNLDDADGLARAIRIRLLGDQACATGS